MFVILIYLLNYIFHNVYTRGVNCTEMSGAARKLLLFKPARNKYITKFVQWFNNVL